MTTIRFGKYRGCTLEEVDSGYLEWILSRSGTGVAAEFSQEHRQEIRDVLIARQLRTIKAAPPITLTPHQQDIVDILFTQIVEDDAHVVRLDGGAGYGKSYAVKKLMVSLAEAGIKSKACAVSYVATQVLAQDIERYGFSANTVAQTLRQDKVINPDSGEEIYILTPDSYVAAANLLSTGNALVVDEASMVSDEIATLLISSANSCGGHLILVGDQYQLPPVKQETVSIACQTPNPATLTVPMRYPQGSYLFALEQTARASPQGTLRALRGLGENPEILPVSSRDHLVQTYVENFSSYPEAGHRMLLFRRIEVAAANTAIRTRLFGAGVPEIVSGERLFILRTSDHPYVQDASPGDTTRYYSGQSFIVEDAQIDTIELLGVAIPHWRVTFERGGGLLSARVVFSVSEFKAESTKLGSAEYETAMRKAVELGRETKDWEPMKQLRDEFVSIAYQYATSVHRAQGQTTDFSYVAPRSLLAVPGLLGNALSYVALTRARKQCVVQV